MALFEYNYKLKTRERLLRNIKLVTKIDTSYLTQSSTMVEHYRNSQWLAADISPMLDEDISTILTAVYFSPELQAGQRFTILKNIRACNSIEDMFKVDLRVQRWVDELKAARNYYVTNNPTVIKLGSVSVVAEKDVDIVEGFKLAALIEISVSRSLSGVLIASKDETKEAQIIVAKRLTSKDIMLVDKKSITYHLKIEYENRKTSIFAALLHNQ